MSHVTDDAIKRLTERLRRAESGSGGAPHSVNPEIGAEVQAKGFEYVMSLRAALDGVNAELDTIIGHLKDLKAPKSVIAEAEAAYWKIVEAHVALTSPMNFYYFGEEHNE
ncbi:hypothetical protein TIN4_100 [Tsukamurella phage TIN4]|uniref:Uncharacterized protein n=2 Tax=Tinduovirus TIN3 TaxID=1982571 RepID=A0A0K0N5Y1_9CAUD|nr:hypothetical protein AVT54_gp025 [Tsukamurella phage TIN3]YP_009604230.1 hypothetical protein FDH87_gp025 [Tsukamurella phage TIN4]AKJ71897.1 hypothetical protein TIN3_100 [Tsukamurella phage TIN3]AKJ72006.1 hypothetical protein TIN4_100 [Tsukamurella phage TIN4]